MIQPTKVIIGSEQFDSVDEAASSSYKEYPCNDFAYFLDEATSVVLHSTHYQENKSSHTKYSDKNFSVEIKINDKRCK